MTSEVNKNPRLLSLDFYRGLTMFLLIAEFSGLFEHLVSPPLQDTFIHSIGLQFHHVEWIGLHFWDLIQPFFMFIVGVAMPLSFAKRMEKGDTKAQIRKHVFKRSLLLLVLGWGLYCIDPGKIVFRFQNVLAQLAVTYLLAYLVMQKPVKYQVAFSFILILANELIYRFFPVEGFNEPFVAGRNFGAWFNILISGAEDGGHWAMFNAIPTAAHTIWGVLAGKLLMSDLPSKKKIQILLVAGIIGLVVGYGLSAFTPIIKRISTGTFVLASGGWAILSLALCYWLIDGKGFRWSVLFFAIVGINPLFIYLFAHVGGARLLHKIVLPFSNAVFFWAGETGANIMLSLVVLFLLWYMCYWMYRKKIFIRI